MKQYDVFVAGSGIGGICAAVAAARCGASVLLTEALDEIGGTGVHSPVGLICRFHDNSGRPVNCGIHQELFPEAYQLNTSRFAPDDPVPVYDEHLLLQRYHNLLNTAGNLTVLTSTPVTKVYSAENGADRRCITAVDLHGQPTPFSAKLFIDCTGDGNLAALAGADCMKGRTIDGKLQSATLTFKLGCVDFRKFGDINPMTWGGIRAIRVALQPYYDELKARNCTTNARKGILCFPCPDRRSLLFNSVAVLDVDPTNRESLQNGREQAERQVDELYEAIRQHPALQKCPPLQRSAMLGIREGRRVTGDYILTAEDILNEARFPDMVAACAYGMDIHDPTGKTAAVVNGIPGSGYYHIPLRSLTATGFSNLLTGSRCISGTHEAHSSYRVMCSVAAIGEAAGTAAAIGSRQSDAPDVRSIDATTLRLTLKQHGQFIE